MESRSKEWLGRTWIFLMGVGLASAGGFFCWWLWAAWERARLMDSWLEVKAEVVSSKVIPYRFNEFSEPEFVPEIRYRYLRLGQTYEGGQIRRVPVRSASEEQARRWVKRFPQGREVLAYVNPRDPDQVVLKKNSKAALYAIWFPALFVALGLRMSWKALLSPDKLRTGQRLEGGHPKA